MLLIPKPVDPPEILHSSLFRKTLGETIPWCKANNNQRRSHKLSPSREFTETKTQEERIQMVANVAAKRAKALLPLDDTFGEASNFTLSGGSLLLYAPDENLFDGAAECQSKGFFDVNNVPPWDCWLVYSHPYLVSWIAPASMEIAQAGVEVNPEECIFWADHIWDLEFLGS